MELSNNQHKAALVMKTVTEIIGGAQGLLNISYKLEDVFEDYLDNGYKTFLHILRVMEAALPPFMRGYAGTGRKPYPYQPFIRSMWAKCFFKIETTTELIRRLRIDSNLRVLCGFEQVPGKSTFSRNFTELSETTIMEETLDKLVKEVHEGRVVYHVSRDSTAIEARERVDKEGKRGRERGEKAAWEAEKGGKAAAQRRKRAREAGT